MKTIHQFRQLCLTGGIGYVLIFVTGIYANFGILEPLKATRGTDAAFTDYASDLQLAFLSFLVMVIADLVLTWVLHQLFATVNSSRAALASLFRFVNCMLFAVALVFLSDAQAVLQHHGSSEALFSALGQFDTTWQIGLLFFGAHLMVLSCLIRQSGYIHKIIGSLLFIAGAGYCVDSALSLTLSTYSQYAHLSVFVVALPGVVGELALTGWLLIKGFSFRIHNQINTTP